MATTRHHDQNDEALSAGSPQERERLLQWHRLFGISLMEALQGAPWRVELEKELALKSQLLDVVIIESADDGDGTAVELPDGLESLRPHNLLTYKSMHESLNAWALDELTGHYVNYRKLHVGPKGKLPKAKKFGLYAVATLKPKGLKRAYALKPTPWDGVYDLRWGSQVVRIIVLNEVEKAERNAYWELFASEQDRMRAGLEHYRARKRTPGQRGYWELLEQMYIVRRWEISDMAYTLEDFLRETHERVLANMTPEERLKGLGPEERLKGLGPEERLKGLDPELIEAWLAEHRQKH